MVKKVRVKKGPFLQCTVNDKDIRIYTESPRTQDACYELGIISAELVKKYAFLLKHSLKIYREMTDFV